MATQAIEQAPAVAEAGAAAAPSADTSKRNTIIFGASGLVVGIVVGFFVLGPIFAKHRAAVPPSKPAEAAAGSSVTHSIENLVLNPAGTGGQRFLMVNATFKLKDGAAEQLMKEHESEVRDRILGVLGRKTVEELSDISQRERIKKEVLDGVSTLFPKGSIVKVFFAQFVIQ